MAIQLGYAAITSRLLPPSTFGAYAVALSGVGLISMVGGSSLGQSAARRDHDSVQLDRSLVTLALVLGGTAALVAMLLAPIWGQIWDVPESVPVTRVLAVGIPVTALASVLAGILRRGGRTSAVAGRTAIGQLTGMAIGLAAVLSLRTAWSLGVTAVAGAVVSGALLAASLPRERLIPTRPTSASANDAVYGVKSAGMDLLRHTTNLMAPWSIGRFGGAAELGSYNRATTMLTGPLEVMQRAFSYSLFTELRPGGSVTRSPRALTDVMILVTWPAVFVGGIGYFAAEPFILLILGSDWEAAGSIAGLAVLLGIAPMFRVPIGSALEARAQFGITWVGWLVGAIAIALGALRTAQTGGPEPAMLGLLTASIGATLVYAFALTREGMLDWRRWAHGSKSVIGSQALVSCLLGAGVRYLPSDQILVLAWVGMIGCAEACLLWLVRRKTAFWRVARIRGLIRSRDLEP